MGNDADRDGGKRGTAGVYFVICGGCSIAGLLVSIFTAGRVVKIAHTINSGNTDDHSANRNKVSKSTIYGSYVGRDSVNGTQNDK